MTTVIKGGISTRGNITGGISKAETVIIKELTFNNRFEFPSIGKADQIYIATDENKLYRFDETSLTYYCVGSDYSEIKTIQCGLD